MPNRCGKRTSGVPALSRVEQHTLLALGWWYSVPGVGGGGRVWVGQRVAGLLIVLVALISRHMGGLKLGYLEAFPPQAQQFRHSSL